MDITKRDYTSYTSLLPHQFKDATQLKSLLSVFLKEDQNFFDELYKLFEVGLDVDNATGYQLDIIGKLVTEYREGRDDDDFREAIKFSQFIANSSGTIPELITYLKQITESSIVRVHEHYPATLCMEVDGNAPTQGNIQDTDESAIAGVDVHSIIHSPNNVAIRPTSVNNAYDNLVGGVFQEITDINNPLYYAQRPSSGILVNMTSLAGKPYMYAGNTKAVATGSIRSLYDNSRSLAGRSYMSAGNTKAVATGLTLIDETVLKGRHPEVYTRGNN